MFQCYRVAWQKYWDYLNKLNFEKKLLAMFVLISVEDNIVVEPKYFGKELDAIQQEIRIKYVNKANRNLIQVIE